MPTLPLTPPKPKLLDCVRWHLRVKHYSIRTEELYLHWIRRYILFHQKRHPDTLGEEEIAAFLSHLAIPWAGRGFHSKPGVQCPSLSLPAGPRIENSITSPASSG
jgi:hypothetical protein